MVTRRDVDAFLGMRPPRTISPCFGEYTNRGVPALFVTVGLVALVIGVVFILVPESAGLTPAADSSDFWNTRLGQGLFMVALGGGTALVIARARETSCGIWRRAPCAKRRWPSKA